MLFSDAIITFFFFAVYNRVMGRTPDKIFADVINDMANWTDEKYIVHKSNAGYARFYCWFNIKHPLF